jgi:CspA family cold shock protein
MATGTLKSWNAERGFGFIVEENGGPDILLHIRVLKFGGIDPDKLIVGERLIFDVENARDGRIRASNVRRPD